MKNILLGIGFLFSITIAAQSIDRQVIGSLGGGLNTSNVEISHTAGEAVIQSFTTGSIILTQGFQQSTVTSPNSIKELNLDANFSYYPNPVQNVLNLNFNSVSDNLLLEIKVYDVTGTLLLQQKAEVIPGVEKNVTLNLSRLSTGSYVVHIYDTNGSQSSFNIVKTE